MAPSRIHLVRHGEVENPGGVLYGRLAGFVLSTQGEKMAAAAAKGLVDIGATPEILVASPLQRTVQSAAPIAQAFRLKVQHDERFIEPWNIFEGQSITIGTMLAKLHKLYNPLKPSWGEPYLEIVRRVREGIDHYAAQLQGGDLVVVSHQAPIWLLHRSVAGERLAHHPGKRRCELSSITSFEFDAQGSLREVGYHSAAAEFLASSVDEGAV